MNNIPKVIHYCWFGNNKKPQIVEKSIKSWKEKLPDYEIKEWNEENFKIDDFQFTREAYKSKKWAFVSDYCRVWVLYNYGGIYLDTDIEVVKNLDGFLNDSSFGGVEFDANINFAIWGCKKNDSFLKVVLDRYDNLDFLKNIDNLDNITIPLVVTEEAEKLGFKLTKEIVEFGDGVKIYPKQFFYPKENSWEEVEITKDTYTIHHYEGSWKSPAKKMRTKLKSILVKLLGYKNAQAITNFIKRK